MKLPKKNIKQSFFLIIFLAIILISGGYYLYFKQQSSKTIDNFPIWLMRDGRVAVYREMKVDKNKNEVKKTLVVQNLGNEDQKDVKIYEVIPKEIAEKASDLQFSIQPEIIEDDPVVLWNVGKPGEKTADPSIKESLLFLPKLGAYVVEITAKAAVAKASGICETKTAKGWMAERGINDPNFFNCVEYMGVIQKEVQERQTKEWQNKLEENKVITSIDSTNVQYKEIKVKAKEIIKKAQVQVVPVKSTVTISKEEAIDIVKKTFKKQLAGLGEDSDFKEATCEKAEYVALEGKWHIFCTRPPWEVGYTHEICRTSVQFISVTNEGKAKIEGSYSDCYGGQSGHKVFGKPMWGVQ